MISAETRQEFFKEDGISMSISYNDIYHQRPIRSELTKDGLIEERSVEKMVETRTASTS